ncbi:DUF7853 family protein [Haladaptatus pallidirubidus]|uniref:DUF7853 family protein n=1 Tax=Haladaptatus pallidirubidus TaxID=1008152 RepID=UPI003F6169CA
METIRKLHPCSGPTTLGGTLLGISVHNHPLMFTTRFKWRIVFTPSSSSAEDYANIAQTFIKGRPLHLIPNTVAMPTESRSSQSQSIALYLPLDAHWTLHHVLLHRIDRETTADDPVVDPPPLEIFQAFETIDAGRITFSTSQLEAMQGVLAEYHHSTSWWESERSQLERLLHDIATKLDDQRSQ